MEEREKTKEKPGEEKTKSEGQMTSGLIDSPSMALSESEPDLLIQIAS